MNGELRSDRVVVFSLRNGVGSLRSPTPFLPSELLNENITPDFGVGWASAASPPH